MYDLSHKFTDILYTKYYRHCYELEWDFPIRRQDLIRGPRNKFKNGNEACGTVEQSCYTVLGVVSKID